MIVNKVNRDNKVAFIVDVYRQMQHCCDKKSILKKSLSLSTPQLPLKNFTISEFDDEMMDQKTCKLQYFAISALNGILTIQYCVHQKMVLNIFHLQNGSFLRLHTDSHVCRLNLDQLDYRQQKLPILDSIQFATRICKYL